MNKTKKTIWTSLLLLIFIGPVVLAWIVYNNKDSLSFNTTNRGHLIKNPIDINKLSLYDTKNTLLSEAPNQGKWFLLYVSPQQCTASCEDHLYKMRQIRLAVGKEQDRVERVIVTYQDKDNAHLQQLLAKPFAGTQEYWTKPQVLATFLAPLSSAKEALSEGYLYFVDPNGNVMMSYAPDANGSDILKDLQKLLRVSKIG